MLECNFFWGGAFFAMHANLMNKCKTKDAAFERKS